jgi:hypothetical protein
VGPSLEEAFGQVYVEAAACGTPSIGYPVGGVPEALADGVSGRLAAEVSPGALAEAIDELYTDGDLRRNLGRWGRVWAESEHSTYAAFHRMHTVLRGLGVGEKIGLSCKINFTRPRSVPEPSLVMPEAPGYRVLWGLEHWEGPRPEKGLGRFRWSEGPSCGFEFQSERAGGARLILGCRNTHEGQRVRLVHGGKPVGERPVPVTGDRDRMLVFDIKANKGVNRFELHHWKWGQSGRKHALLVTGLNLVR